jgi:Fic family protein
MEKDLLEVERQHLSNVMKELDQNTLDDVYKKFELIYTYDAVGMVEKEQKEILNHLKAFEFVKKEVEEHKPFTEEKLKDIHEILVEGIFQGGVYRNVNINIFGATHQPPDYVKVYDRMAKFFRNLEEFEGTPLEKATYAHASIAKIHPFVDANGRLAKLVLNYFLMTSGYLPISIPISEREAYIDYLEAFKTEKDLKPLHDFFKKLLLSRYEEVLKELDV